VPATAALTGYGGSADAAASPSGGSVPGCRCYDSPMLGAVVIVQNSGERTVDASNGRNGRNLSWSGWKAGSARRRPSSGSPSGIP
jgi:hypothetical protein